MTLRDAARRMVRAWHSKRPVDMSEAMRELERVLNAPEGQPPPEQCSRCLQHFRADRLTAARVCDECARVADGEALREELGRG